jgi:L-aminopeptidase/D-esterase-like protein
MKNMTLTALPSVRVGHSTHPDKLTGCTVIIFDRPYPAAYQGYGGGIASFHTDSLRVGADRTRDGFFIAGGSVTGLASAGPIIAAMIREGAGRRSSAIINPSISGAAVYDQGTLVAQYDPQYGREAYDNASRNPVPGGNVGAGTGVTVGKFRALQHGTKSGAMKTGVGNACVDAGNGVLVCALTVLNAFGNVVLPDGRTLAGNRDEGKGFLTFDDAVRSVTHGDALNTTVSVVGTTVNLGPRENYERLAHFASQGHVRAIYPVQTAHDGDTVFVFSTGELPADACDRTRRFHETRVDGVLVDVIGHLAARAVRDSIYDACRQAESVRFEGAFGGVFPSAQDYPQG